MYQLLQNQMQSAEAGSSCTLDPDSALFPRQNMSGPRLYDSRPKSVETQRCPLKSIHAKMFLGCRESLWDPHKNPQMCAHPAVEAIRSYVYAVTACTTY